MKFFVFVSFVWMMIGGNGVYATVISTGHLVSKSRAVSAQFYREVQRLRQNLGEAERLLYANHRVEEKLMQLVAKGAKNSTLTSGVSVPPRITLGMVVPIGDGKEIDAAQQNPEQLLEMIAGKDFIKALRKVNRSYQLQWQQLQRQKSYIIDFSIFVQRNPVYAFMLQDKHATILKRNAASRILIALGIEPNWEALPLEDAEYEVTTRATFSQTIIAAKQASADFYQALEGLTQEFLNSEQELYREYDVTRKVSEYLLQKSIKGEFYGGTISKITRDSVGPHDLLSTAISPDYITELEALYTEYLEGAAKLPLFEEHAEHTKLWDANYMEMFSERRIAFKLKDHVVDNLIKELIGTAVYDKDSDYKTIQP